VQMWAGASQPSPGAVVAGGERGRGTKGREYSAAFLRASSATIARTVRVGCSSRSADGMRSRASFASFSRTERPLHALARSVASAASCLRDGQRPLRWEGRVRWHPK
jgi:hypothetical protein